MKKNQDVARKHHWLIAATVIMVIDGQDGFQQVRVNGVVHTEAATFRARDIAAGQRVAQLQVVKKIGAEVSPQFVDVILDTVAYLGHFTDEEFQEPPKGTAQEEVPPGAFA